VSSLPPDEPPRLRARERGRARRRLRFLRQFRELQMRDAGGFVFELYRFGEQRDELVRGKLDALIVTDKEIRALEILLGQAGHGREIRLPGIGGACPHCGAFHAIDSRFCAACGATLGAQEAEPALAEDPPLPQPTADEPALAEEPPLPQPTEVEPVAEEPTAVEPIHEEPIHEEPGPGEPIAVEPVPSPAPPEPGGEVTIVRRSGDEAPEAELGGAPSNGAVPGQDVAHSNGHAPADASAEEVAPAPQHPTPES
jgi:hypothetical protein